MYVCIEDSRMGKSVEVQGTDTWSNENLNSTCTLKNDLYDDFEE